MHPPTWQTSSKQLGCPSLHSLPEEQFCAHFVSDRAHPPAMPHWTQTFFEV
jgi:hypothetical protein